MTRRRRVIKGFPVLSVLIRVLILVEMNRREDNAMRNLTSRLVLIMVSLALIVVLSRRHRRIIL